MGKKNKSNPVCVVVWQDAAYAYTKKLPKEVPALQHTTGFVLSTNARFTTIATNVVRDHTTGALSPVDGFVVPEKTIIRFKKIGFLDHE